ncbi:hypothetical protein AB0L62_12675 [Nocardia asteroides]|uniref:hypothetical protein n=1 Tax=Nocardia asteroides TaxID=1824 RepID=UPI00343E33D9
MKLGARITMAVLSTLLTATSTGIAYADDAIPDRAVLDGPARMFALRTFDSGFDASASAKEICRAGLGPIDGLTQVSSLDARFYAPIIDTATGLITVADAQQTSPMLACVGLTASLSHPVTNFARLPLRVGTVDARGRCSLRPSLHHLLATLNGCTLAITPADGLSGTVTSASYTDLVGVTPVTTGSVWTASVLGGADRTVDLAPIPPRDAPTAGDLRHAIFRAIGGQRAKSADCPSGFVPSSRAQLHPQQPDPGSGELIEAPSPVAAGAVTLCSGSSGSSGAPAGSSNGSSGSSSGSSGAGSVVSVAGVLTMSGNGSDAPPVPFEGHCTFSDVGAAGVLGRTCELSPSTRTTVMEEGVITVNGLVSAQDPSQEINAPVWVVGGFGTFAA